MLRRIVASIVLILCFSVGPFVAWGDDNEVASRVVFLPFDVSAAGKYAPLQAGLQNMLVSRLAVKDRIEVVEYGLDKSEISRLKRSVKTEEGVALFEQLNTDYIVSGGLFALDRGLQLQVAFHPAAREKQTVKLSILAEGDEEIVEAVDLLSKRIAEKIFGYESQEVQPGLAATQRGSEGFRTDHPEKMYKKGFYRGESMEGTGQLFTSTGIRKSLKIPIHMVSMATGDLDGDGGREIIMAGSGELRIFQFRKGIFKKISSISVSQTLKIHAINIADVNKDGKKEIYVSANDGFLVSSLIMEWSPQEGGRVLLKNIPWYIRPLEIPGEGTILAGQNRGLKRIDAVRPGIFRLVWAAGGKKLKEGETISLPRSVNLFDFLLADLDGDGSVEKIVINHSEKLLVYNDANRIQWVSEGEFGGSKNYLGPRMGQANESGLFHSLGEAEEDERVLNFVPTRLIVTDANNDGKPDIVIGRNKLTSWRFLENLRSYEGGFISCLTWNGTAMTELWRTNNISGYVADYSFVTVPLAEGTPAGEGMSGQKQRTMLYVGQIPDRGVYSFLTPGGDDTQLLAYELNYHLTESRN